MTTREKLKRNGLYRETITIVIPAGTRVEQNRTITAQRGNVKAVGLVVANGTDLQYSQVEFTLANNGFGFLQKDNLLAYAPSYRSKEPVITPMELDENGVLNQTFDNQSAVAITAIIILYYYNPFDLSLR